MNKVTINPRKIAESNPSVDLKTLERALREAKENRIKPKSRTNSGRIPYISKNSQDGAWTDI